MNSKWMTVNNKEYVVTGKNRDKFDTIEVYIYEAETIMDALVNAENSIRRSGVNLEIISIEEKN